MLEKQNEFSQTETHESITNDYDGSYMFFEGDSLVELKYSLVP